MLLYVAILKAKESAVYLLDMETVSPKDTIKNLLLTIDKLALAMAESKKAPSLENATKALLEVNNTLPKIYCNNMEKPKKYLVSSGVYR